jgi:hypothetical protein
MDTTEPWDDVLEPLPPGWRLGPVRFFPKHDQWEACAETIDGEGCVMGTGPDAQAAMADLIDRLERRTTA